MLLKCISLLFCLAGVSLSTTISESTQSVAVRDRSPINNDNMGLPPIPSNIATMVGPPLVGIILNWFLYGILVMQLYVYYQCFPNDRKRIKWLVYGLFALDTVQSILGAADAFFWFAKGFGNMSMLSDPYISPFDTPIMDGIIAFIVQSFFCWRIRVLQKSWWLPSSVFAIAVVSLVGSIAMGVGAFQIANLTLLDTLKWQLSLWLGGSALTDTLIAVIMTVLLLQSRTRQNQRSNSVLVRIVRLTVETNTATASVAIIVLVCLLAIPNNPNICMAPAFALGKLYSNTLLAVFNNRVYMNVRGILPRSQTAVSTGVDSEIKFRDLRASSSQLQMTKMQLDDAHTEPFHIEVFHKDDVMDDVHPSADDKYSQPAAMNARQ